MMKTVDRSLMASGGLEFDVGRTKISYGQVTVNPTNPRTIVAIKACDGVEPSRRALIWYNEESLEERCSYSHNYDFHHSAISVSMS